MSNARVAGGLLWLVLPWALAVPVRAQECREGVRPAAVLRGEVVEVETRVPLQEAEVRLSWETAGGLGGHEVKTDSLGRWRVCDPPTGVEIEARAKYVKEGEPKRITVPAGDSASLVLEATSPHSVLRGRVLREGGSAPVGDAEVRVLDTPLGTITNASGEFTFAQLPPGKYRVQFEHLAFGTRTDTVRVEYRSTVELVARLADRALRLPSLEVSVRSHGLAETGFYDRRDAGFGEFLTRREWEAQSPRLASDLVRMVPGVRVVPSGNGFDNVVVDRRNCALRYYMDGARLGATFRLDDVPAHWIEALEVYRGPSEVPAQFRSPPSAERASCGVIVIWTRRAL